MLQHYILIFREECPSHLPLLVDELLWSLASQTVYQLSVIAAIAVDKFGQQCGPSSGLGRSDGGPGTVGDAALEDCPGKKWVAAWRQQVKAD